MTSFIVTVCLSIPASPRLSPAVYDKSKSICILERTIPNKMQLAGLPFVEGLYLVELEPVDYRGRYRIERFISKAQAWPEVER